MIQKNMQMVFTIPLSHSSFRACRLVLFLGALTLAILTSGCSTESAGNHVAEHRPNSTDSGDSEVFPPQWAVELCEDYKIEIDQLRTSNPAEIKSWINENPQQIRERLPQRIKDLESDELEKLLAALSQICGNEMKEGRYLNTLEYKAAFLQIVIGGSNTKHKPEYSSFCGPLCSMGNASAALEIALAELDTLDQSVDSNAYQGSLMTIAICYMSLTQYDQAMVYLTRLYGLTKDLKQSYMPGNCLKGMGNCYSSMGQCDKALECHQQAYEFFLQFEIEGPDGWVTADTRNNMALTQIQMGRYGEALENLEFFLENTYMFRDKKQSFETKTREAWALNNIGGLYADLGLYAQSKYYISEAIKIKETMEDAPRLANSYLEMGRLYLEEGSFETAVDYVSRARAIYDHSKVAESYIEATVLLGEIALAGEDYPLAEQYLTEASSLAHEGSYTVIETECHLNLGRLSAARGDGQSAKQYLSTALSQLGESSASLSGARILRRLGEQDYLAGDLAAAIDRLLEAESILKTHASQFSWESGLNRELLSELHDVGSLLAEYYVIYGDVDAAFQKAQVIKAIPLYQLLHQAQYPSGSERITECITEYRSAQSLLQYINAELVKSMNQQGSATVDEELTNRRASLKVQRSDAKRLVEENWNELEKLAPWFTHAISIQSESAAGLRNTLLQPQQVLLEYLQLEDSIIAFVLPWNGPLTCVELAIDCCSTEEYLSGWLDLQVSLLADPRAVVSDRAARQLHSALLEPLMPYVGESSVLLICPDQDLYQVSFEALVDGTGRRLVEDFTVSYGTSATFLDQLHRGESQGDGLLVGISFQTGSADEDDRTDAQAPDLPSLAGIGRLIEMLQQQTGADVLLDKDATKERVLAAMPNRRFIQMTTHGQLAKIPLLNGFYVYSPPDEPVQSSQSISINDPAFISISEIVGLSLSDCELVVLACCYSAAGSTQAGQGLISLSQGFMCAGADTVIAANARVFDRATIELLTHFYRHWQNGSLDQAEALRKAKLDMLGSAEYALPRYWAPFVMYGVVD